MALRDFYGWFVDQDLEELPDPDRRIAERVDLLFAEYTGGYLDQRQLLLELESAVPPSPEARIPTIPGHLAVASNRLEKQNATLGDGGKEVSWAAVSGSAYRSLTVPQLAL